MEGGGSKRIGGSGGNLSRLFWFMQMFPLHLGTGQSHEIGNSQAWGARGGRGEVEEKKEEEECFLPIFSPHVPPHLCASRLARTY